MNTSEIINKYYKDMKNLPNCLGIFIENLKNYLVIKDVFLDKEIT